MKFIILPIEDAKIIFSEKKLETHRKSIDESQVIVHEETLLEKRQALGLGELPTDTDGIIQWTYPNYEYNTDELNNLLESDEWTHREDYIQPNEEHTGTQEDPIPYNPPMELIKDKYYIQNDILYKCTRNSEIPLSHNLDTLIGTYVEIIR